MVTKCGKRSKARERCDKGDIVQFSKGGISTEIPLKLGHLPHTIYETNNSAKGHSKKKDHFSVPQAKGKVSFAHHYFLNVPGELTVSVT